MFFRLFLLLIGFTTSLTAQAELRFSPAGGFSSDAVSIEVLLPDQAYEVYITRDGSRPNRRDEVYQKGVPIHLFKTTVLRCVVYDKAGKIIAENGTTYFIDKPETDLAIISVGIDPYRLFDPVKGWFVPGPKANKVNWKMPGANFWTHDEFAGHLDLFEPDGRSIFHGKVGYRLFGGMSRLHPQKSLSASWRKRYGSKRLEYPLFGAGELSSFKYLVFRNGGSDWSRTHFRDAMMSDLLKDKSWDLEHQANRPALLYINGKYWGLYYIREKINRTFVADHRGIDRDSLDLLEHQSGVKAGSDRGYKQLLELLNDACYFANHNSSRQLNDMRLMANVEANMDIDNFMRLQIAQMYFDNRDAGGNIRFYRPWSADKYGQQQWRWILYDLDYGFGLHDPEAYAFNTLALHTAADGPEWPNPPWSTFIQRCLLTNDNYQKLFVNRSLDYLQTDFREEAVKKEIDRHANNLRPEMPRALKRWKLSLDKWETQIDRLHTFAERRPAYVREHLREAFAAGEDRKLVLKSNEGGGIEVNANVLITDEIWEASYFQHYPLQLRAVAEAGHRFVGWKAVAEEKQQRPLLEVPLEKDQVYEFEAVFETYRHPKADQLMITEVSTRADRGGNWIEVYYSGEGNINLRDWQLIWDGATIVLPNVTIASESYLLFFADREKLIAYDVNAVRKGRHCKELEDVSHFPENIGLYNSRGAYVDEVSLPAIDSNYLGLAGISLDNSDAGNWLSTNIVPSPGDRNLVDVIYFHIHYNQLWKRLGIALLLIVVGWSWLRYRHPKGD